jgi:hypothetical protein
VQAVVVVALVSLVGLLLAVGAMLFFRPWDTDVPPASENPAIPSDVTITSTGTVCGSGGCFRELTLQGRSGEAPDDLADRLGLAPEICHEQPGLTPRQVCATATAEPSDGHLVVQVRYVGGIG